MKKRRDATCGLNERKPKGENSKNSRRRSKTIKYLITILTMSIISFVLLLYYQKTGAVGQRVIEGVVVSFIASLILFVLTEFVFKDTEQIDRIQSDIEEINKTIIVSEDIKRYGILGIKNISYEDDSDKFWLDLLADTHEKLFIMAHSLSPWFQEKYESTFWGTIRQLVLKGKDVKIIILKPNGDNLKTMINGEVSAYSARLRATILKIQAFQNSLSSEQSPHFVVKLNGHHTMPYTYIRNERQILVSPYFVTGKERSNFMILFDSKSVFSDSFNNDFNELFSSPLLSTVSSFVLVETIESKMNRYSASNWTYEDTYKHIFSNNDAIYEVGYYKHYNEKKEFIDHTLELPSSYGCPFKCKYCASSSINNFQVIKFDELIYIIKTVLDLHKISKSDPIHITFTGTGDFYYTKHVLLSSLQDLIFAYPEAKYTFSSCAWTPKLVSELENARILGYIKYVQMTFISLDSATVKKVIPNYIEGGGITELVDYMSSSPLVQMFRINYLMIEGINDKDSDFQTFISAFEKLKGSIIVRISKLNETKCSQNNGLNSSSNARLNQLLSLCKEHGYKAYIFSAEKNDNMNCGQLITERDTI